MLDSNYLSRVYATFPQIIIHPLDTIQRKRRLCAIPRHSSVGMPPKPCSRLSRCASSRHKGFAVLAEWRSDAVWSPDASESP